MDNVKKEFIKTVLENNFTKDQINKIVDILKTKPKFEDFVEKVSTTLDLDKKTQALLATKEVEQAFNRFTKADGFMNKKGKEVKAVLEHMRDDIKNIPKLAENSVKSFSSVIGQVAKDRGNKELRTGLPQRATPYLVSEVSGDQNSKSRNGSRSQKGNKAQDNEAEEVRTQPDNKALVSPQITDDSDDSLEEVSEKDVTPEIETPTKSSFIADFKESYDTTKKISKGVQDIIKEKNKTQDALDQQENAGYSRKKWNARLKKEFADIQTDENEEKINTATKILNPENVSENTLYPVAQPFLDEHEDILKKVEKRDLAFGKEKGEELPDPPSVLDIPEDLKLEVESLANFKIKMFYYLRVMFLFFVVIYLAVILTNLFFYSSVFNEDKEGTDFSSPGEDDFKAKFTRLLTYLFLFWITIGISFVLVLTTLYVTLVAIHLPFLEDYHVKSVVFQKAARTLKNFIYIPFEVDKSSGIAVITSLGVAIIIPLIFFMIYSAVNKSFVTHMQFSEIVTKKEDEDVEPLPQPKLFLWHYALMVIAVFGLSLILMNMDEPKTNLFKMVFYIQSLLVICMLIISAHKNRSKLKAIIAIVAMILIIGIYFALYYISPSFPKGKLFTVLAVPIIAIIAAAFYLGADVMSRMN